MFERTYAGGEVESKTDGASNTALPRSIGTNDHVQVWTRTEFDKVIGDKVLELNAYDGSRHISLTEIRYRLDSSDICLPILVSD